MGHALRSYSGAKGGAKVWQPQGLITAQRNQQDIQGTSRIYM
jgi:hypothetical protein